MRWTDYAQAVGSIATALALLAAVASAWVAWKAARTSAEQAEAYAGAQSAISWRDQVFHLHERGLTPGQIRYIIHLEDGGARYEGWNGRIDDLVRNLPPPARPDVAIATDGQERLSCDAMPDSRDGCRGPCKETLRATGCSRFRERERERERET